ncbi:D-sedoheptulose 7-phosphate isomerase [Granulicella aggregans]|uniref:Phosphoheptose isomerase n=1 Tax=Granulicella aggregans TaxID=474949 RepID=A0A7W7ZG97_9BACT|nr:D-sedoheptulose 7-phosphate isomerase [Granulicella aggregans]MBB5059069.1 D-sedoheptulose 7-phosphate isomerase [Granulicella aggregans]
MKSVIRRQIAQSIATLEAVLADERIAETLVRLSEMTAATMKSGGKLLVAGNGGSAADAQHLVAEFVGRLTISRPALRAVALTVDTSILTAVGNDFSFDHVFERQVEALGAPGDIFLGISTSGNSKNIVKAVKLANQMGLTTVGFSGNDGGAMAELCQLNIVIPSSTTMNIQESHLVLEHIYCMLVELCYFGPEFGSKPQALAE